MKIAFASCIRYDKDKKQTVWDDVAAARPDYLFLLGDQIYMDFFPHLGEPAKWDDATFDAYMRERYAEQWAEPHFARLLAQVSERQGQGGGVYGTWDDHDFAWNNANGVDVRASLQTLSRGHFFRHMRPGAAPGDPMYQAVPLHDGGRLVGKAIFLDTRSYREAPGDDSQLLGEEQFRFLADELQHTLPLTIFCAGTPMRATGKGWLRYKRDHQRFCDLVGDRKALFLTGDIHENVFIPPAGGTRLYEIVSSGAAVKKFAVVGKRRNHGLLDWTDARTEVTLFDKRGQVSYSIDNATYDFVEHEPD